MAEIEDFVDVQATLLTSVAPQATFGINLVLTPNTAVPSDTRVLSVTRSDFEDVLAGQQELIDIATTWFGQKRIAAELVFGRWLDAGAGASIISGPRASQTLADYQAITSGSITINQGSDYQSAAIDLSGVTDINQVAGILQTALRSGSGTWSGTDTASITVVRDSLGRFVIEGPQSTPQTGALSVNADAPISELLDLDDATLILASGPETAAEAEAAISDVYDDWYNMQVQRSASSALTPEQFATQALELAQQVNAKAKLLDIITNDLAALSPTATDDIGNLITGLGLKRITLIWHRDTAQYPGAAAVGAVLPAREGSTSFAFEDLSNVTESGLLEDQTGMVLTNTQKRTLRAKGYNYIETVGNNTFLFPGLTAGNEEKRIMLGRDWFVADIAGKIFTYQMNEQVTNFDNDTLTQIGNFILETKDEAVTRNILVDTPLRPFTLNIPDADLIPVSQRASRALDLENLFEGFINSAINTYRLIGTWRI